MGLSINTNIAATRSSLYLATNAANIFSLGDVTQELFTTALQNVATLRANNGGQTRHLQFAQANVENQITNLSAANGRIMDVDIAQESSNLAKQQILVQASASMVAQANSQNNLCNCLILYKSYPCVNIILSHKFA